MSDEVGRRPVLLVALGDAAGVERPLHARRLGRLAVRGARAAGPRDRPRARRRERRDARPSPAPRPGSGRAGQRRRERRRDRARDAGLRHRVQLLPGAARAAVRRAARAVRDRVRRRARDARAGRSRGRVRLTPQRPSVPGRVRRPFLLAALAVSPRGRSAACSSRSARSSRRACSDSSDHMVAGVGVFVLAGSATVAQLVFGRSRAVGRRGGRLDRAAGRDADDRRLGRGGLGARSISPARWSAAPASASRSWARCARSPRSSRLSTDRRSCRRSISSPTGSLSLPAVLAGIVVTPLGLRDDVRGVRRRRRRARARRRVRGVAHATAGPQARPQAPRDLGGAAQPEPEPVGSVRDVDANGHVAGA